MQKNEAGRATHKAGFDATRKVADSTLTTKENSTTEINYTRDSYTRPKTDDSRRRSEWSHTIYKQAYTLGYLKGKEEFYQTSARSAAERGEMTLQRQNELVSLQEKLLKHEKQLPQRDQLTERDQQTYDQAYTDGQEKAQLDVTNELQLHYENELSTDQPAQEPTTSATHTEIIAASDKPNRIPNLHVKAHSLGYLQTKEKLYREFILSDSLTINIKDQKGSQYLSIVQQTVAQEISLPQRDEMTEGDREIYDSAYQAGQEKAQVEVKVELKDIYGYDLASTEKQDRETPPDKTRKIENIQKGFTIATTRRDQGLLEIHTSDLIYTAYYHGFATESFDMYRKLLDEKYRDLQPKANDQTTSTTQQTQIERGYEAESANLATIETIKSDFATKRTQLINRLKAITSNISMFDIRRETIKAYQKGKDEAIKSDQLFFDPNNKEKKVEVRKPKIDPEKITNDANNIWHTWVAITEQRPQTQLQGIEEQVFLLRKAAWDLGQVEDTIDDLKRSPSITYNSRIREADKDLKHKIRAIKNENFTDWYNRKKDELNREWKKDEESGLPSLSQDEKDKKLESLQTTHTYINDQVEQQTLALDNFNQIKQKAIKDFLEEQKRNQKKLEENYTRETTAKAILESRKAQISLDPSHESTIYSYIGSDLDTEINLWKQRNMQQKTRVTPLVHRETYLFQLTIYAHSYGKLKHSKVDKGQLVEKDKKMAEIKAQFVDYVQMWSEAVNGSSIDYTVSENGNARNRSDSEGILQSLIKRVIQPRSRTL